MMMWPKLGMSSTGVRPSSERREWGCRRQKGSAPVTPRSDPSASGDAGVGLGRGSPGGSPPTATSARRPQAVLQAEKGASAGRADAGGQLAARRYEPKGMR